MKVVHTFASTQQSTLRISFDTKAKVKIGPFSRLGYARSLEPVKAIDHDMGQEAILVPAGILEVDCDQLNVIFGTSRDNADFVADCIEHWWSRRGQLYGHIEKLVINLDNAPEINSSRTQFMNRLVQFVDRTGLKLELAYYPPYHSKYNPIERCWGILEQHWNGTLLTSIDVAIRWARSMTWRGVSPLVDLLEGTYERGVKLTKQKFQPIAERLKRSERLGKWHLCINPLSG